MFVAFCLLSLCFFFCFPQQAVCGDVTASAAPVPVGEDLLLFPPASASPPVFLVPDPFSTTLRILTSLAIIILLVFALSWLLRRRGRLGGSSLGRLLGVFSLDSGRHLYVVDILGKVMVLGVTEHHISVLCEITDKPVIDGLRLNAEKPGIPGVENLFRFLTRKNGNSATSETDNPLDSQDLTKHTRQAQDHIRQLEDLIIKRPPGEKKE